MLLSELKIRNPSFPKTTSDFTDDAEIKRRKSPVDDEDPADVADLDNELGFDDDDRPLDDLPAGEDDLEDELPPDDDLEDELSPEDDLDDDLEGELPLDDETGSIGGGWDSIGSTASSSDGSDGSDVSATDIDPSSSDFEQAADPEGDLPAEDPNKAGLIRVVPSAHLVHKRYQEDGTYTELWVYKSADLKDTMRVRNAILSGTDIPTLRTSSKDGSQRYVTWTVGNVEMMQITGMPS